MNDVQVDMTFTPEKTGSTRGLLMILQGQMVLHSDRMDNARAKDRTAFLNKLKKLCASIDTENVQRQMLAEVRRASEADAEPEAQPPTELNVNRIVRPHLFHLPEVSGLLVPVTPTRGRGDIEGTWLLFIQWAEGKRQCIELVDYLDVAGGGAGLVQSQTASPFAHHDVAMDARESPKMAPGIQTRC